MVPTRPIVDLDQRHFQSRAGADAGPLLADGFLEYSKKTMQRYEESNLKIESFRLCIENFRTDCFSLVKELIVDAMRLGACDLNIELMPQAIEFDLPHEVLRSENIVRLSVSGCRIDLGATGGNVGFSKLKSLSLRRVFIVGFFIFDIISYCPLLEELVLSECTSICTIRIRDMRLHDRVRSCNGDRVEIRRMLALGSLPRLGSIVDAQIRPYDNLKCLYLQAIQTDKFLFNNMSKCFPCLKNLTLIDCLGFEGLQVYSPSLEFLSVAHMALWSVKFDVPSLRKFTFKGSKFPHLSFKAASREWESDISVTPSENYISSSWLHSLKKFLMKFSLSKISLSLCFGTKTVEGFDLVECDPSQPKPAVENLMLSMCAPTSVCSSLLKCVLSACRPKFVTHGLLPELSTGWEENRGMLKLLRKTLMRKGREGRCVPSRGMFDKYGLEKVDVEVFEDSLAQWRRIPWKVLFDASNSLEKKSKTRFKLGWGENPSAH